MRTDVALLLGVAAFAGLGLGFVATSFGINPLTIAISLGLGLAIGWSTRV